MGEPQSSANSGPSAGGLAALLRSPIARRVAGLAQFSRVTVPAARLRPPLDNNGAVVSDSGIMTLKRKHQRTLEQIRKNNGATHWKDVEALLVHGFGADVDEGSGSSVTFFIGDRAFTADRPHPRRECGIGLVKRIRRFLDTIGRLDG